MNNSELKHLLEEQNRKIEKQDKSLEQLCHTVRGVKEIAINIGEELDRQQDMLVDMGEHINHTNLKLKTATNRIEKINNLERNYCILRLMVAILVVVIITVLVVKFS